jgi:hypothetical protein
MSSIERTAAEYGKLKIESVEVKRLRRETNKPSRAK